ncbi:MAG TPA: protein kinase [Candidatus Polarisedimenticolaceae bacterium]|nr:protein kinase [Candidatus Polarisedimenticolaceae bacterium]
MLLHYRLIERLGEGGMGVVWKAVDTTLDREVAIKILPAAFAADPERLHRFEREAKVLASLNHPNVAAVYGLHQADGIRFLAMELVRGRSLAEEIHRGLVPGRTVELALAIADGLAAAHRNGIVHRDLKPDNVMIDAEGRPKILDFGLAKTGVAGPAPDAPTQLREQTTTQQGTLMGTVAYMSPEQAQGKPVDPRSDVFSFGIVLYEMATGRRPFAGDNTVSTLTAILRDTPARVTSVAPSAPEPLDKIVARCLEKDPARRYADASGVRDDLRALQTQLISAPLGARIPTRTKRLLFTTIGILAAIEVAVMGACFVRKHNREAWVRNEALPQLQSIIDHIQGLQEGREAWDAWVLARKIEEVAPGEPLVESLRKKFSREIDITSDPPGAEVVARYYDEPDAPPVPLGKTPLTKFAYPLGFTRLHLALPGKAPVDDVVWNLSLVGDAWSYTFHAPGEIQGDKAWIPPQSGPLFIPGLDDLAPEPTVAFLMDRHEVTNREYKKFVDAGGYTDAKYWKEPFQDGARTLTFAEAMARCVDRTGRPGPATWEIGGFPAGHDEFPVAGVSWYEAAAYAEWAGERLPTIFHWNRVAFTEASSRIIPMANLAGKDLVAVGTTKSANRWGVSDLAGNVREWVSNPSGTGNDRFILGGGWNDPDYAFADAFAQPAWDRAPTDGFRCIKLIEPEPNLAKLDRAIERQFRDFKSEKPVPDAVFAQYLRQFDYDKTPLDAKIEEEKEFPTGVRQKITFNAAYGGERMMAYLFLPPKDNAKPPYQVVIQFPGSGSIDTRSSETLDAGRVDFLVTTGRAMLFPIYKGTYERGGDLHTDYASPTAQYRDYVTMWSKDLARSIDYVESRKDLDAGKIAYYGLSWGGALGAILPAVEHRIKCNVLYVAGLGFQRALPEVDVVNYVGRVKQPTLILNGELDFFFPAETSQKPMFDLLGAPSADKKRLVFPGGHSVPRTEMIKESLAWLDKYLGAVRGQ